MLPAGYRNRITASSGFKVLGQVPLSSASPFSPDLSGEWMRHFSVYSGLPVINYA